MSEGAMTQPPVATDTPAVQDTPLASSVESSILGDLGHPPTGDTPNVDAWKATETPPAATEEQKEDGPPVDDPALILQRDHYLKELNKVRALRAELEAQKKEVEEEARNRYREPEPKPAAPAGDDDETCLNFKLGIEPDDFEHDSEVSLANAVIKLEDMLKRLAAATAHMYSSVSRVEHLEAQSARQHIASVIEGGAKQVETEFGLKIGADDVGASLKRHARALAESNGGSLPLDAGYKAWLMDNMQTIMATRKPEPTTHPNGNGPTPLPPSPDTVRTPSSPLSDADSILRDMSSA